MPRKQTHRPWATWDGVWKLNHIAEPARQEQYQGDDMKLKQTVHSLIPVLVAVFVASTPLIAKQSRTVRLPYTALLNGKVLAKGEYKVTWEQHSPEATVTVKQGKDVVTTAQAKWVDRDADYPTNEVLYTIDPDGSRTIAEIRFAKLKGALVFQQGAAGS
jgi:hypothetical protein